MKLPQFISYQRNLATLQNKLKQGGGFKFKCTNRNIIGNCGRRLLCVLCLDSICEYHYREHSLRCEGLNLKEKRSNDGWLYLNIASEILSKIQDIPTFQNILLSHSIFRRAVALTPSSPIDRHYNSGYARKPYYFFRIRNRGMETAERDSKIVGKIGITR